MSKDNVNAGNPTRYCVDLESEEGRSVALLISDRRNYLSQQHDTLTEAASADPELMVDQVAGQSSDNDFLLPDTPLKEAVFRVILSRNNDPMSPLEISEELKRRWSMSAYPRSHSPAVIERLLRSMENYSITSINPPEADPAPETKSGRATRSRRASKE